VGCLIAAANYDPAQWERPARFNPARPVKPNRTFGAGVHFCVGAPRARLELQIALPIPLARLPGLRLVGQPEYADVYQFHGQRSLVVGRRIVLLDAVSATCQGTASVVQTFAAVWSMRERIKIDDEAFKSTERQTAFDLGNALLASHLRLQQHFGLRAEVMQVFLLIILATVQKLLRRLSSVPGLSGTAPVPAEFRGGISRRQIATILGIPLETVRRHVDLLATRGLVEERHRGCVSTRGGTLQSLSDAGIPRAMTSQFVSMVNSMTQTGAVRVQSRRKSDVKPGR
jgi:cytochrome P450